jgi:hypothetical protein
MKNTTLTYLAAILLGFSTFTALGQEADTAKPVIDTTVSKVSFGFTLRPEDCYRLLSPDAGYETFATARNNYEIPKLGSTIGVNFNIKLSKAFSIESGLLFSNQGYKTSKTDSTGAGIPPALNYSTFTYSFHYIDIPAKVNCTLVQTDKISIFISVGLSANILMAETIEQTVNSSGTSTSTFASGIFGNYNVNMAAIGGIGFNYYLGPKACLRFEPVYTRCLIADAPNHFNEMLYSYGLDMGIYVRM